MRAYSAFTLEIDDLETAVAELAAQIAAQGELATNSCGIVFCDYDIEVAELAKTLYSRFAFPIIGNVGPAVFTRDHNASSGISLTVLTADDCWFRAGASGDLTGENASGKIADCYGRLADSAPDAPKLIMAFTPCNDRIADDDVVMTLDRVSHGVPVFGGRACDDTSFTVGGVLANDKYLFVETAILLIGGNVNPRMAVSEANGSFIGPARRITGVNGCNVTSLDDRGFVDCLQEHLRVNELPDGARTNFLLTPFVWTHNFPNGDRIRSMVIMREISLTDNRGIFLMRLNMGDILQQTMIDTESLISSARNTAKDINWQMNRQHDYHFSAAFGISCCSRYWLLGQDKSLEINEFTARIPQNLCFSGFYSCGEFSPVHGNISGKLYNLVHNNTFAVLVL